MTLPKLETATYELTLPSTDISIKYRPFLVKEEKILLQALESGQQSDIINGIKDIVSACTFGVLNVEDLPTFDLEYVFLQIRAKSVGEISTVKILCPDDKETYVNVDIDLTKVEVQVDDSHTNNIVIDEDKKLGLVMKYPTMNTVEPDADVKGMRTNQLFKVIGKTIHQIYEGEKVYNAIDYTEQELNDFIENLSPEAFVKIQDFLTTMPRLRHEIEVENPNTKVKSKITLQGLVDFFVSPSHTIT